MAIADIVEDVRRILQDEPLSDSIATAPAPADTGTTISFGSATLWFQGDVVDFPTTKEQALITSADQTNPFTIVRNYNETTAGSITTSHRAYKWPRFGTLQIEEAVGRVVSHMWPEVYEITTTTITPSTTAYIYNVPTNYEGGIALVQASLGTITDIQYIRFVERWNVPTGVLASGKGIKVPSWHRLDQDGTLTYQIRPTTATTDTQVQHLMALGASEELLLGEAAQLVRDTDRAQTAVQDILRSARFIGDRFDRAKASWRSQLIRRYGPVRRYM